jgi:hypothetical protein
VIKTLAKKWKFLNIVDLQCLKKNASIIQDQLEVQLVAVRSVASSNRRLQMLVKVRRRHRVLLGWTTPIYQTKVLPLLLAQQNLTLSDLCDTLLRHLADHHGAEAPAALSADPRPSSTLEYSTESLRSLGSNLVPLLRDVLAQQNGLPPTMPPQPPPVPSFTVQNASTPHLDFCNPVTSCQPPFVAAVDIFAIGCQSKFTIKAWRANSKGWLSIFLCFSRVIQTVLVLPLFAFP